MAEEEKPKQLVQMSTVVASGITAIVAALFTSRLGVAGTLIGSALTPMIMTVGVAVLNAQIEKATTKISDLPSTVRGHLSTQRVRIPGSPRPEDAPETAPDPPGTSRRSAPGMFDRLLSIPSYLRETSPAARRRVLLTGALAGLVAAAIGLVGVTGVEAASGSTLSCSVWNQCASSTATSGSGGSRPSVVQALGGSGTANDQYAPSNSGGQPGGSQQRGEQPATPGASPQGGQYQGAPQGGQQAPSGQTPQGSPANPAPQGGQSPAQDLNAAPQAPQNKSQEAAPSASPGAGQ